MRRTTLSYGFIIVLVAFAGCNVFGGGPDSSLDGPTFTPMDVPTDEPTPTDAPTPTLAPRDARLPEHCVSGLARIGVANASALEASHFAALGNTSFTVRVGGTRIARNGSVLSRSHTTVHIARNYSRLYFISEGVGGSPPVHYTRFERWTNHEQVLTREISGQTVDHEARPVSPGERGRHFTSLAGYLAGLPDGVFDNATACVTDQFTHNGTALFVVAFASERLPQWFGAPNNATVLGNVTGRALVGSSGIVSEIRWNYTTRTADGAVVHTTKSKYYTEIGSTTVERPLWYEKAVNQTQTTNRTTTAG